MKLESSSPRSLKISSLPTRERGLKCFRSRRSPRPADRVAPYAGAWIEIAMHRMLSMANTVAPYAGAWIEITVETLT